MNLKKKKSSSIGIYLLFSLILLSSTFTSTSLGLITNSLEAEKNDIYPEQGTKDRRDFAVQEDFKLKDDKENPLISQLNESISFNLSLKDINDHQTEQITISAGVMYNFTINSVGAADFDFLIATYENSTNYQSQETSSILSDLFMRSAGVPWWGDYDSWDNVDQNDDISNQINKGISLNSGEQQSFLIYSEDIQNTLPIQLIAKLTGTENAQNNLLNVSWTEISLENPEEQVILSDQTTSNEILMEADSIKTFSMETLNGVNLTKTIINKTVAANSSIRMIIWRTTIAHATNRITQSISGELNQIYMPIFNNLLLDSQEIKGFLINTDETNQASLDINCTQITDESIQFEENGLTNDSIRFHLDQVNQYYKILTLPENPSSFTMSFDNTSMTGLLNWDISVQFFAIGVQNAPFSTLDANGADEGESIKFFTNPVSEKYKSTTKTIFPNPNNNRHYWWANYDSATPTIGDGKGGKYLGIKIEGIGTTSISDVYCDITINAESLRGLDETEEIGIGADNGSAFEEFDIFQVRSFTFANYTQYQWQFQAKNTSNVEVSSYLACYNASNQNQQYVEDMNNALISTPIDTTSSDTITLEFDIEGELRNNDNLYVYIQNSSGISDPLVTFTNVISQQTWSQDISQYNDSQVSIIFNLTTNDRQNAMGPLIDNVRIFNGTEDEDLFLDTFDGELQDNWEQQDNSVEQIGGLWHLEYESQNLNSGNIDVVYPNRIYRAETYIANPYQYTEYEKNELNLNPTIQSGDIGYLVISSDATLTQNISVTIDKIEYLPTEIKDNITMTANLSYSEPTYQGDDYYLERTYSDDFYRYYKIQLVANETYRFSFEFSSESTILLTADTLFANGTDCSEIFIDYYNFFIANQTYLMNSTRNQTIYLNIDPISYGTQIDFSIARIIDEDKDEDSFPWELMTIGILAGLNAIAIAYIVWDKKFRPEKELSQTKASNVAQGDMETDTEMEPETNEEVNISDDNEE